ncbi:hypothetical protein AB4Y40_41600 [Paraburkholderia sp. EG287B]|uniref:hypothetical protein n=1 Tax=Paraburkholderia sp. EG287B TaxID=3237010 RepID=UPI0034D22875
MQKTTIVDQYGAPLSDAPQLVVAYKSGDGTIDTSSVQPLSEWNRGPRNLDLVTQAHGYALLNILTYELGMVDVDPEGLLRHKIVATLDPHVATMRVLGKIAEAVVVQECNESILANRKWGMVARRGNALHWTLDQFQAIGTGLASTQRDHPTKYNPTDTQRDVLWVRKSNAKHELLEVVRGGNSGNIAGLQIKVSQDGFKYIYRSDVARGKYEVPLVYFDLSNDYYRLANAIYNEERDVRIGVDLVRGRDISPECHDLLESYYWVVLNLVSGKLSLNNLIKDELLFDAFKKDVQEQNLSKKIVVL